MLVYYNMPIMSLVNKILAIFLFVALVAGWFYWFQWRPTEIRRNCAKDVALMVSPNRDTAELQNKYDLFYETCLNQRGLK